MTAFSGLAEAFDAQSVAFSQVESSLKEAIASNTSLAAQLELRSREVMDLQEERRKLDLGTSMLLICVFRFQSPFACCLSFHSLSS